MKITEEIKQCTDTIIKNQIEECQWNDRLLQTDEREEFEKVVLARSEAIRRYYVENEECIGVLKGYCTGELNDEIAGALYESARAMLLSGRLDMGLICQIAAPVREYMVEHNDVERGIIITAIQNACTTDYYNRMMEDYHIDELEASYRWVMSFKDRYAELENMHARKDILLAFNNLLMLYVQLDDLTNLPKILGWAEELKNLWHSEAVQKLDGTKPEFAEIDSGLYFYMPLQICAFIECSEDVTRYMMYLCHHFCDNNCTDGNWDSQFIIDMIDNYEQVSFGKISIAEAVEHFAAMIQNMPDPNWENDLGHGQMVLQLYILTYTLAMRLLSKTAEIDIKIKEQFVVKFLGATYKIGKNIPYNYNSSYISSMSKALFYEALPNVADANILEHLIDALMLQRQPSTYFHCRMVEQIALLIAEEMYAKEPQLFVGIPGYKTLEDVLHNKKTIMNIIERGARLHDLGKCAIAPVIMQQSRRIVDDEFMCIKRHPDIGAGYLENNAQFAPYIDIIRGHHKTYDGKGGYPYSFDNTASPYRILIDLISISDSTDAATDILGRNYTPGKDFLRLLGELKEGAGTRYNPDIVRIISETPELIERLTELTGPERIVHCYEAYHGQKEQENVAN